MNLPEAELTETKGLELFLAAGCGGKHPGLISKSVTLDDIWILYRSNSYKLGIDG